MLNTAAAQLGRLMDLIPRLADDKNHLIETIRKKTGLSSSQLMSDLVSISDRFGDPEGFVEGVRILIGKDKVNVHASHFLRPMRLTMRELCALELGLMLLRPTRTPMEQAPIDRALTRLRETVSRVPAQDRHVGTRYADLANAGSAEHLHELRIANRTHRKVRLTYRSSGAKKSSARVVSPHSLVFVEQMWYVVSTNASGDMRLFRLDRIGSVVILDETFEPNEELRARVQAEGRAFASNTEARMTVRYSPRIARWLAEREGKKVDADGSLTLEHPLADESWAIRHVLQYGPDAEILSPESMRDQIAAKLAAL